MQAQLLIPMATSLCFGLALSTVLVLFLVPVFYQLHIQLTSSAESICENTGKSAETDVVEPEPEFRQPAEEHRRGESADERDKVTVTGASHPVES